MPLLKVPREASHRGQAVTQMQVPQISLLFWKPMANSSLCDTESNVWGAELRIQLQYLSKYCSDTDDNRMK